MNEQTQDMGIAPVEAQDMGKPSSPVQVMGGAPHKAKKVKAPASPKAPERRKAERPKAPPWREELPPVSTVTFNEEGKS